MSDKASLTYFRVRWPDEVVPEDEPLWLLYEVDEVEDNVLRTVEIFQDGRIDRNSLELERRHGDTCPSLIEGGWREGMSEAPAERIEAEAFDEFYCKGVDTPVWFVR